MPYSRLSTGKAELEVGVDGVVALVLQAVGADLVADADAAALVAAQVDDDAEPLLGDLLPSPRRAATPQSQRSEPNTSPVRHSLCTRTSTSSLALHVAPDERDVLLAVEHRLVDDSR